MNLFLHESNAPFNAQIYWLSVYIWKPLLIGAATLRDDTTVVHRNPWISVSNYGHSITVCLFITVNAFTFYVFFNLFYFSCSAIIQALSLRFELNLSLSSDRFMYPLKNISQLHVVNSALFLLQVFSYCFIWVILD